MEAAWAGVGVDVALKWAGGRALGALGVGVGVHGTARGRTVETWDVGKEQESF